MGGVAAVSGARGSGLSFSQSFGDDMAPAHDAVTALTFSPDGDSLCVGDAAGRVCILSTAATNDEEEGDDEEEEGEVEGEEGDGGGVGERTDGPPSYSFALEYQSHLPGFDPITGRNVAEAVRSVSYVGRAGWRRGPSARLLSCNGTSVKLWSVREGRGGRATLRAVYNGSVPYETHSVLPLDDGTSMVTADELRVRLWDLERGGDCPPAVLLDSQPGWESGDLAREVMTATDAAGSLLLVGTSAGAVRLYDVRERSRLGKPAVCVGASPVQCSTSASVSGLAFVPSSAGPVAACSRDFFALRTWDFRQPGAGAVCAVPVHDYLRPHAAELESNECIFDPFGCAVSPDGSRAVTGSYGNRFVVADFCGGGGSMSDGGTDDGAEEAAVTATTYVARDEDSGRAAREGPLGAEDATRVNLAQKVLLSAWHPVREDVMAVAAVNKLYVYRAEDPTSR